MLTSLSGQPPTNSDPVFTIQHPEKSRELDTLTDSAQVKFPDIFKENISSQMVTLLGQLPAFESMISRNYRIINLKLYQFLVSRGYETPPTGTAGKNSPIEYSISKHSGKHAGWHILIRELRKLKRKGKKNGSICLERYNK